MRYSAPYSTRFNYPMMVATRFYTDVIMRPYAIAFDGL